MYDDVTSGGRGRPRPQIAKFSPFVIYRSTWLKFDGYTRNSSGYVRIWTEMTNYWILATYWRKIAKKWGFSTLAPSNGPLSLSTPDTSIVALTESVPMGHRWARYDNKWRNYDRKRNRLFWRKIDQVQRNALTTDWIRYLSSYIDEIWQ